MQKPYINSHEIENKYGIKASTVRSYRRNHGIKMNRVFNPDINEFVQKADEFKNNKKKLAEYYGRCTDTILRYGDSIGLNLRQKKLTKEQEKEIVEKYWDYSSIELAKEYNVTKECISSVWFRYGCKGKASKTYHILNEDVFKNIDNESAYLLGFIGSDGCLYKYKDDNRQDILSISIQKEDKKILELFRDKLKTNKPIHETKDYVSLQISSNIISEDLQQLGLTYKKTYSNCIANIPEKYMPAFIRGYMDGDGSIVKNKTKILVINISGYQANLLKIKKYLDNNNIFSAFVVDKRKYQHDEDNPFGSLTFVNKTAMYSFLKLIYNNCGDYYMDRKKEKADQFIQYIEQSENVRDKQIVIYYNYAVYKGTG